MRIFAYTLAVALGAMFVGIMLFFFGVVLPLFVVGYTLYKVPFLVREQLRLRRALREIIDGD
ncbi:hypothetical protein LCGC14_2357770 [marine sediment metagenome]|uniref:Uncharacterized protein n=1 Tax=marine sediment metagenome TaxID=412755 RepID=A0A0F9CUS2_9ZZZZ